MKNAKNLKSFTIGKVNFYLYKRVLEKVRKTKNRIYLAKPTGFPLNKYPTTASFLAFTCDCKK